MQFSGSYTYILSQKSRLCKMYSAQNIRRFIGVFHYIQAMAESEDEIQKEMDAEEAWI